MHRGIKGISLWNLSLKTLAGPHASNIFIRYKLRIYIHGTPALRIFKYYDKLIKEIYFKEEREKKI